MTSSTGRTAHTTALLACALLSCASLACDSSDDSGDDVADSSESGDTTDGATSDGGPEDFPPVQCGELTCAEGQICVMPSESCDYNETPPVWVQDPSECLAVPVTCYGLVDVALAECLTDGLCSSGEEFAIGSFVDGTLDCPANGGDCFE